MIKKIKMKKYIVQYYGWIAGYGDWDCDDFVVMAYNIKDAKEIMEQRLTGKLIKGTPSIMLLSTYTQKMKAFEPIYKEQIKEINNAAKNFKTN
jgi:hypothetical protein